MRSACWPPVGFSFTNARCDLEPQLMFRLNIFAGSDPQGHLEGTVQETNRHRHALWICNESARETLQGAF